MMAALHGLPGKTGMGGPSGRSTAGWADIGDDDLVARPQVVLPGFAFKPLENEHQLFLGEFAYMGIDPVQIAGCDGGACFA